MFSPKEGGGGRRWGEEEGADGLNCSVQWKVLNYLSMIYAMYKFMII